MLAKSIMRKRVVTVSPELTLKELADLFIRRGITGAPVVDRKGSLVGVVSQTDLVRHEHEAAPPQVARYHLEPEAMELHRGFHMEAPDFTRVQDVMTPKVVSFDANTPVQEIADLMLRKRIHRVLITRQGQLCGIVTTIDMLKVVLDLTAQGRKEVLLS